MLRICSSLIPSVFEESAEQFIAGISLPLWIHPVFASFLLMCHRLPLVQLGFLKSLYGDASGSFFGSAGVWYLFK